MKSLIKLARSSLLVIALSTAMAAPALADTMRWTIDTTNVVEDIRFQLYSQADDEEWPSSDKVWTIDSAEYSNTYTISCVYSEEICFGAWVDDGNGEYWGVGLNDRYNDPSVCHTCGVEKNVTVSLSH